MHWETGPSARGRNTSRSIFFIRELVTEGNISIHYISTDDNPADIGTKDLSKHRFKHLMDLISNFDVNDFISSKFK